MAIRVFHRDKPSMRLPLISKDARFVVWLGTGAETANMNYVAISTERDVPIFERFCVGWENWKSPLS